MRISFHNSAGRAAPGAGPGRGFWIATFVAFLLCYCALDGARITPDADSPSRFYLMTGDEPHYLMIAHSIVVDGDINLYNNLEQRDHKIFWQQSGFGGIEDFHRFWFGEVKGVLRGHLQGKPREYWSGRLYSLLPPGFPLLIAPAYAIGHILGGCVRFSTVMTMHLAASFLAVLIVYFAWKFTRSRAAAVLIGAALCLAGPVVFYSASVYTELPAAAIVMFCFVLLSEVDLRKGWRRRAALALLGCAVGCLPWLHPKYWVHVAGILAATASLERKAPRESRRNLLCLAIPVAVLLGSLGFYYWRMWGSPLPASKHTSALSIVLGLDSGWPGLWLDRANGLLWYLPLGLLLVPGMVIAARGRNVLAVWMCSLIVVHWLVTGLFPEWTAGRCPPLRYWLPAVPLFVAPLAMVYGTLSRRWHKAVFALAGLAGILVGIQGMLRPARLFSGRHPCLRYMSWLHFEDWAPKFDGSWPMRNTIAIVAAAVLTLAAAAVIIPRARSES